MATATKRMLSPDVVVTYQRDGAVRLPNLYSRSLCVAMVDALLDVHRGFEAKVATCFEDANEDERCGFSDDGSPYMFCGPSSVVVRRHGTAVFSLLGRDLSHIRAMYQVEHLAREIGPIIGASCIRHWQDEFFLKEPLHDNATPWHHDAAAWPFKGEFVPTLWIALTDVEANGSALQTLRGSHRLFGSAFPPPRDAATPLLEGYVPAPDFDGLVADGMVDLQTWNVRAGDGVLFHPRTIHGSTPNHTASPRIAISHRWLGEGVEYKPDSYSVNEPAITGRLGTELNEMFPVVWRI